MVQVFDVLYEQVVVPLLSWRTERRGRADSPMSDFGHVDLEALLSFFPD